MEASSAAAGDDRQRSGFVKLLHDVMVVAREATSLQQALQVTLERVSREFLWPVGHVFASRDKTLEFVGGIWRLPAPGGEELILASQGARYRLGQGWVGQAALRGEPLWVSDLSEDTSSDDDPRLALALDQGLQGLFLHPVLLDGEVLAVLEFLASWPLQPDEEMLLMMDQVSAHLGAMEARQRAAEELRRAAERTAAARRARTDFLASVSHRVRTPMNAVIGMTELLLRTGLNEKQEELAQTARSSGDALMAVVSDVLDFLNIEWGALELGREPFSLRGCAEEVFESVRAQAAEKGLHLGCLVADTVPDTLVSDVRALRQILLNLLRNAVEFTPEGEVVLTVSAEEPEGPPQDATAPPRRRIRFAVRDTGIGIASERMGELFQPFYQAAQEGGGTGLGLAISRELCRLLGGDLEAESTLGEGSLFRFSIEVETSTAEVARRRSSAHLWLPPSEDAPETEETGPLNVLVVEDNPVNQMVARKMLEALHHRPEVVAGGREGLEALTKQDFEVVLMDLEMPDLDGFETTRRIRADLPGGRQPYIIAMTAKTMPGDRQKCIEAGMDGYISKPVSLDSLRLALERPSAP